MYCLKVNNRHKKNVQVHLDFRFGRMEGLLVSPRRDFRCRAMQCNLRKLCCIGCCGRKKFGKHESTVWSRVHNLPPSIKLCGPARVIQKYMLWWPYCGFTFSHYDLPFPTRYCIPYVRSFSINLSFASMDFVCARSIASAQ